MLVLRRPSFIFDGPFPGTAQGAYSREVLEWWYDVLDKLCFVQPKILRFGTVGLAKGWLRKRKDEDAIRRLYAICTVGEEDTPVSSFSFTIQPRCLPRESVVEAIAALKRDPTDDKYRLKIDLPARESVRIVSVVVPLGRVELTLVDSLPVLEQLLEASDSKKASVVVRCKNVRSVRRYVDWLPGGQYVHASEDVPSAK